MTNLLVYVDESGTAVLNKPAHIRQYPFFVIGFVVCQRPELLRKNMKRLLLKLHKRKKYHRKIMELKFSPYSALEKQGCLKNEIQAKWEPYFDLVRKEANSRIVNTADGVFAGVLDKRTIKKSTWTPETIGNFLFNKSLFRNILPNIDDFDNMTVVYDKGRLDPKRTRSFNKYMSETESYLEHIGSKRYGGTVDLFKDADSLSEPGIWAADFVAGSFRHAYLNSDWTYADILKPKIVGAGVMKLWF